MEQEQIDVLINIASKVLGVSKKQAIALSQSSTEAEKAIKDFADASDGSFEEGKQEGESKVKREIAKVFKGIGVTIDTEKITSKADLLNALKTKFDGGSNKDTELEQLKAKIEKMEEEHQKEIDTYKSQLEDGSMAYQRALVTQKLLASGNFIVPADEGETQLKLKMVEAFMKQNGYKYINENGALIRVNEDGSKVRESGKNVDLETDLNKMFATTFGVLSAKGKEGGVPAGTGNPDKGDPKPTNFDWSSKNLGAKFVPPTKLEEAIVMLRNPLLELPETKALLEFIDLEESKPTV